MKRRVAGGCCCCSFFCCYLSLHSAPSFMAGWVDGSLVWIHFILHWNFIGCSTNSRYLLNIWVSSRADRRPLGTWRWTQPGYSFWLSIYFTVRCLQLYIIPASKENIKRCNVSDQSMIAEQLHAEEAILLATLSPTVAKHSSMGASWLKPTYLKKSHWSERIHLAIRLLDQTPVKLFI